MTKYEKIIIGITGSSHSLVHALMLTFPSLIPIVQKEFNVGLDTLGFVVSISALLFGLGAIPAGWLDRYLGGKKLMIIYQLGSSIAALVVALSSSFYMMVIGLSFIGLFCSIYHPTGLTLVSQNINKVSKIGGIILLITGILIITNQLQALGFYLLEIFPFLQNFG